MNESMDWSQVWLDAQRQYWNALLDWSKQNSGALSGDDALKHGQVDLSAGSEAWWKHAAEALPGDTKHVYRKVFDAGRNFFELGELLWNTTRDMQAAGDDWRQALEASIEDFKRSLDENAKNATDAWSGFAGGWGLGGDAWQDFMKTLGQAPVHAEDVAGFNAGEAWNRLWSAPSLGYTREYQEKLQQWMLLSRDYTKAAQEYAALLHSTNGKAVDLLGRRIIELVQKGEGPETLRGMYDLWVDCGEEAYGELTADDAFLKSQGDLTNALMRLKKHEGELIQSVLSSMNIPGRREFDTALRRLQETRRELRDLRDMVEDAGMEDLLAELASLKQELHELKSADRAAAVANSGVTSTASGAKKAVSKKTAPRKKIIARKKAAAKKV